MKKVWAPLMESKRDEIVEKMQEAYGRAEGGMSGWYHAVEMDQDGNIWTAGPLQRGSQSEAAWKGETTIIANIGSWNAEVEVHEAEDHADLQELRKEYDEDDDLDQSNMSFYEWLNEYHEDDRIAVENEIVAENKIDEVANYYDTARDLLDEIIEQQKEQDEIEEY